jgi:putative transposase
MHFEPNKLYHIHNIGINRQPIFFSDRHYQFFLKKIRIEWYPFADIIAYCLLPTQFHFILQPNSAGCRHLKIQDQLVGLQKLSQSIGHTLSSYTIAVNKQLDRTGCLFHKKTRHTELNFSASTPVNSYDLMYRIKEIHSKPVLHGVCKKETDWEFSSAREYAGLCKSRTCRKDIVMEWSLGLAAGI